MAYENIKNAYPNLAVVDNYFFTFDSSRDVVIQKVDDGDTAFEYPIQIDLDRSIIIDNFESINIDLWDTTGSPTIVSDGLECYAHAGTEGLLSNGYSVSPIDYDNHFIITGNFDIRVMYEITDYDSNYYWDGPTLRITRIDSNRHLQISRRYQTGGTPHVFRQWYYDTSSWTAFGNIKYLSGSESYFLESGLRIYRSGSTVYTYYWNGSSWVNTGSTASQIGSNPIRFRFYASSWDNNPDIKIIVKSVDIQRRLTSVQSLQYDGRYFWTLQRILTSNDIVIRKWSLENYVCVLIDEFIYFDTDVNYYNSDAFALENYITKFSAAASSGAYELKMDEYYDSISIVKEDAVLSLKDVDDNREDVTVSGVSGDTVYLKEPLQYDYVEDDEITLCNSFFIFNEYFGTSSANGSLMRFSAYDGSYISEQEDDEYKGVSGATFYRFQNVLEDYSDAHALIYVKNNTAKLRNMSDLIEVLEASSANDDFTGSNNSAPDSDLWDIDYIGPYIWDNELRMRTTIDGTDQITSKYNISGNFDVQVSGSMRNGFKTYSGDSHFTHYSRIEFPHNGTDCEFGVKYYGSHIPTDNLVLYYGASISGTTLLDDSGNGYDGTIYGNVVVASGSGSIYGNWLDFPGPGADSGVEIMTNAQAAAIENEFSFSLWFKSGSTNDSSTARIISRDASYYFAVLNNQSEAFPQDLRVYYSDTQNTLLSDIVQDDTWHHVVACWDTASTQFKFYFDGIEKIFTSSLAAFAGTSRPIVLGCNTEEIINPAASQFDGYIDEVRIYDVFLQEGDVQSLYKGGLLEHTEEPHIYLSVNDSIKDIEYLTTTSGVVEDYMFRITRDGDDLDFYYKTLVSGSMPSSWTNFYTQSMYTRDCKFSLGLNSERATVSGAVFDDVVYNAGLIYYPATDVPFYGIMNMDNVRSNGTTIIDVHDLSVDGDSLYRLQDEATYYGSNNSWSTYNYQISPIRSFIDAITVTAYPLILPANAYNISQIDIVVLDQYGLGAVYVPVTFTDDDSVGFITVNPTYTDAYSRSGHAITYYRAGVDVRTVTVEGTVTQYD